MRSSRVFAAVLAVPVFLVCAWLSGGSATGLLVGEGEEGRMADRALSDIAAYYGVGGSFWEYTGPPLVVGWRVKSVEACGGTEPGAVPGDYRAEVEGYSLFGIPRGEVLLVCGDRDENNLRWKRSF